MTMETNEHSTKPHKRYTMHAWTKRLDTIKDAHTRAWAASILYWDFGTEIAWEFFRPYTALYDNQRELKEPTATIISALEGIGYVGAEARCFNRQDEERDAMHTAGRTREFRGNAKFTAINAV